MTRPFFERRGGLYALMVAGIVCVSVLVWLVKGMGW